MRYIIPVLLLTLAFSTGCEEALQPPQPDMTVVADLRGGVAAEGGGAASTAKEFDGWGTLRGKFTFSGGAPAMPALSITKDAAFCGKWGLTKESLVVGSGGGLANVVIYCRERNVPIHESYQAAADPVEIHLDNEHCRFSPHVQVLTLQQPLQVRNPDPIAHNTNLQPVGDAGINQLIAGGGSFTHKFNLSQNNPVPVSCSIHPWMLGYVLPRDNPYVAVTDENGEFALSNVPAGAELEFQVWHESAAGTNGALEAKPDWSRGRFTITVPKDGEETLDVAVPAAAFRL